MKSTCYLTAILNRDIPLTPANIKIARQQLHALENVGRVAEMVKSKVETGQMRNRETYALACITLSRLAASRNL